MHKIFIDFETQSNKDIRLGVNHYISCPDFRAYLLSYSIDGKEIETIELDSRYSEIQIPKELKDVLKSGNYLVISHNTNFDVTIWNHIFPILQIDWNKTFDTSWFCRVLNVPASLEKATQFFGISEKDLEGKKVNSKYYKPIEIPESELGRLIEYNRQDVKSLIELYETINIDYPLNGNKEIYEFIQKQNKINVDLKTFEELRDLSKNLLMQAESFALKKFPTYKKGKEQVSIAYSANEIKKYLKNQGINLTTISKNKIEEELNLEGVKLDGNCQLLIDLYRVLQAKGLSKYDTFQEYLEGKNYVQDFQISHGTHTGRPAGRGIQLHNISRPPKLIEKFSSKTVINAINQKLVEGNFLEASQYLSSLIWACLIPDAKNHIIGRYDLSAIEPRVGAFLRNDFKTLDLYRNADLGKGKDEYTIFGEKMNFPESISRQLSKVIILAACYGMGAGALRGSCINSGLPDPGDMQARNLLNSYHALNPSVKSFWYQLEKKFLLAITSGYASLNSLEFGKEIIGGKVFISVTLPSGRQKFYSDCSVSSNGKILYNDSRLGKIELRPYLLYENLVQAAATDVLFLKAKKISNLKDCEIKLTIYDEIILSTVKKNVKVITKIMGSEEEAFPNMPLSFKGGESLTFWKGDKV